MPTLHIQLFGAFQVTVDGQPWDDFRSDKARALLAYLAVEGATPRRRGQLTSLLWAGYKASAARASLRVTLTNLRHLPTLPGLLQTTRQTVQWSAQPDYACDALTVEKLLESNPETLTATQQQMLAALAEQEFLPGFEEIDSLPFQAWVLEKRAYYAEQVAKLRGHPATPTPTVVIDWGEIPYTTQFHGRQPERATLTQWLVTEQRRLVAIFGMGGGGKTALAAQLVRDLSSTPPPEARSGGQVYAAPRFARVLWRSLAHAPPLAELLLSWLQALSNQQVTHLPALLEDQLALLMSYLRTQPCLLVLDKLESILQGNRCAGCYRPGYEGYGELLRRVAASEHQSCLLLTSREQPQDFRRLQTHEPAVGAWSLRGLVCDDVQQLLRSHGLSASDLLCNTLLQRYSGNPLALQIAAETIAELFAGNVANFLAQTPLIFDDLRTVLDQQFARLSPLEQTILYELARTPEPVKGQALFVNLAPHLSTGAYVEAKRSLLRRLLIEPYGEQLDLPKMIRTYILEAKSRRETRFRRIKDQPGRSVLGFSPGPGRTLLRPPLVSPTSSVEISG